VSGENDWADSVAARASLSRVRQLLLQATPQGIQSCLPHIQTAIQCLKQLQARIAPLGEHSLERQQVCREIQLLQREVANVNALLQHAGRFSLGWATFVAASGQEYTAQGRLFPAPSTNRVAVDG
jgi:hypothetical protein